MLAGIPLYAWSKEEISIMMIWCKHQAEAYGNKTTIYVALEVG